MTATSLRSWMTAIAIAIAGCGTNDPGGDHGGGYEDDGDDDAWGTLSIDGGDFVVDGARWVSPTSEPVLRGTFRAEGPVTITAGVIGGASAHATIEGTTWQAKLPRGSVIAAGSEVTVVMTNTDGEQIFASQAFVLDVAAPAIGLLPSLVDDERGDTIDFSSGEPVHTHDGPEILLDPVACTTVYKHGYLMTQHRPMFGDETARNPLAYVFWIDDARIDPSFTAFRLRTPDDVLRDWTPIATNGWKYVIWLLADGAQGAPELATRSGTYLVDVRARDWAGIESTVTWCFELRLLAAPLELGDVEPAPAASDDLPALWSMSMAAGSPMSLLAGTSTGPAVASQRIVQYTAEPIVLTHAITAGTTRFARTYVDDYVATAVTPLSNTTCEQARCDLPPLADPADSVTSGVLGEHRWQVMLIDEATNRIVPAPAEGAPVIPPRGAHEAPRAYRLVAHLGESEDLRPAPLLPPAEHTLGDVTYTGRAPFDEQTRCTATTEVCRRDTCVVLCTAATTYKRIIALDRATLAFDGLSFVLATSVQQAPDGDPAWSAPRTFTLPPAMWESGDADLPGPH